MGKIENQAARLNMWSALAERLLKIVSALGGWSVVAPLGVGLITAWTALVAWVDSLPLWAAAGAGLVLASLSSFAFVSVKKAWAIRGLKKLNVRDLGADCVRFREDAFEFLMARHEAQQAQTAARISTSISHEAAYQEFELQRSFSNRTSALVAQKFGHRLVALVHLLKAADIEPPNLWSIDYELPNVAAYIGAIGELLERGLLDEARSLSNDNEERLQLRMA